MLPEAAHRIRPLVRDKTRQWLIVVLAAVAWLKTEVVLEHLVSSFLMIHVRGKVEEVAEYCHYTQKLSYSSVHCLACKVEVALLVGELTAEVVVALGKTAMTEYSVILAECLPPKIEVVQEEGMEVDVAAVMSYDERIYCSYLL